MIDKQIKITRFEQPFPGTIGKAKVSHRIDFKFINSLFSRIYLLLFEEFQLFHRA